VDKIRGDLALASLNEAERKGFQILVVDGGSSSAFVDHLHEGEVQCKSQEEPGMSASRRQAIQQGSSLEGVEAVAWVEPEKVSFVRDCLSVAAAPILDGSADMVIPKRDKESWNTYPSYQADHEKRANRHWNSILRKSGILPEGVEDLDVWFGPRIFKNDSEILGLFA